MAALIPNVFSSYELTEKEALQGSVFTVLQIQYMQNQLSGIAEEKINLEFDPANPTAFVQMEASLKGQMDILTFLISSSAVSEDILNNPDTIEDVSVDLT